MEDGKVSHIIDGTDEQHSNWMRFVNCARNDEEQNLLVMQYRGEIYYKTLAPVEAGSELLVWYQDSCVQRMDSSSQKDQSGEFIAGLLFPSYSKTSILLICVMVETMNRILKRHH